MILAGLLLPMLLIFDSWWSRLLRDSAAADPFHRSESLPGSTGRFTFLFRNRFVMGQPSERWKMVWISTEDLLGAGRLRVSIGAEAKPDCHREETRRFRAVDRTGTSHQWAQRRFTIIHADGYRYS